MNRKNTVVIPQKERIRPKEFPVIVEWDVEGSEAIELVEAEEVYDYFEIDSRDRWKEEAVELSVLIVKLSGKVIVRTVIFTVEAVIFTLSSFFFLVISLIRSLSSERPVRKGKGKSVTIINNIHVSSGDNVNIKNNIYVN